MIHLMNIPKIVFNMDFENEVSIFCKMLGDKEMPYRMLILSVMPKLRVSLEENAQNGGDENVVIRDFLTTFYKEREEIITHAFNESKEKAEREGENILNVLAKLMDYEWSPNHSDYTFTPTVLPMSPFDTDKNIIYFSLSQYLKKPPQPINKNKDILALIAHEISHLILREILEEKKILQGLNPAILHLLQEIFAPILMNRSELKPILGINDYYGNPYLKPIILNVTEKEIDIVDYFSEKYNKMRDVEHKTFSEILDAVLSEMEAIKPELIKRMELWDKNASAIFSNEELKAEYSTPIKIMK